MPHDVNAQYGSRLAWLSFAKLHRLCFLWEGKATGAFLHAKCERVVDMLLGRGSKVMQTSILET